ncbi:uncharacterized protein STEHIDRAFT_157923 [Stereum hirsutum FP-91666 SS1]|uniref:uncharacterized protein n=1 Tax=Stereum hirsutum (strain FP-91666) TaxID=721885 RepID=UPI000444A1FE|nr:uncharacterized protein STEHIDRAFT_157923 [Stereum hirsutum FP-91666 SS1]EIM85282.1 hypothetical protein STEHIDRAFT_157923 [Stereum hirsutum FP-91666 SS1]
MHNEEWSIIRSANEAPTTKSEKILVNNALLTQILSQPRSLHVSHQALQAKLNGLSNPTSPPVKPSAGPIPLALDLLSGPPSSTFSIPTLPKMNELAAAEANGVLTDKQREKLLYHGRVMLTSEFCAPLFLCLAGHF